MAKCCRVFTLRHLLTDSDIATLYLTIGSTRIEHIPMDRSVNDTEDGSLNVLYSPILIEKYRL